MRTARGCEVIISASSEAGVRSSRVRNTSAAARSSDDDSLFDDDSSGADVRGNDVAPSRLPPQRRTKTVPSGRAAAKRQRRASDSDAEGGTSSSGESEDEEYGRSRCVVRTWRDRETLAFSSRALRPTRKRRRCKVPPTPSIHVGWRHPGRTRSVVEIPPRPRRSAAQRARRSPSPEARRPRDTRCRRTPVSLRAEERRTEAFPSRPHAAPSAYYGRQFLMGRRALWVKNIRS